MEAQTLARREARECGFRHGSGDRPQEGDGGSEAGSGDVVHFGQGLAAMPKKLVKAIASGLWTVPNSKGLGCGQGERGVHGGNRQRKEAVPNIGWWHSCFTLFERSQEWAGIHRGAEMAAY